LTALQTLVSDFVYHTRKCGKQLKVKLKFKQEGADCQRTISEILLLNSEKVLLVDLKQIAHTGTKSLKVYADDNFFLSAIRLPILGALITEILGVSDFRKLSGIELVGTKCELESEL
jgi:hypothetical protein